MPPLNRIIADDSGGFPARVSSDRSLHTTDVNNPLIERNRSDTLAKIPDSFRFVDSATETSSAMNVDGSVSSVEFIIPRRIFQQFVFTEVVIKIESDNSLDLNSNQRKQFGSAGLLTNGIDFEIDYGFVRGGPHPIFPYPVKKIEDLVLFSRKDSIVNLLRHTAAAPDQLIVTPILGALVILPHIGNDEFIIRINDNLTSLNSFEAVAFGYVEGR